MNNKKIFLLLLLPLLAMPMLASALTVQDMVDGAVRTTFYIADGVIVILWVVTGILFLVAQGSPEKLGAAKKALIFAVVGTIIIIIANSAVYLVGNAFNVNV